MEKVEFIESYIKIGNGDYQWNDNHGELIRCKDCKWFHQAFKSEGRCLKHDNDYHEPNWFCADGEKRE